MGGGRARTRKGGGDAADRGTQAVARSDAEQRSPATQGGGNRRNKPKRERSDTAPPASQGREPTTRHDNYGGDLCGRSLPSEARQSAGARVIDGASVDAERSEASRRRSGKCRQVFRLRAERASRRRCSAFACALDCRRNFVWWRVWARLRGWVGWNWGGLTLKDV